MAFELLGTLVATTAVNQGNTATPFTIPTGTRLLLQTDAAVHVAWVATGGAATTSNGVELAADEKFFTRSGTRLPLLSAVGTANVKVFAVYDDEG